MADKPQSRFWAGPDSSEVESEASISDSEEEVQAKPDDRKNQWKLEESDSESQDDGQRVVKSAKHKADDDFQKAFKEIKNAININDWNNITTLFQKLSTLLLKHANVTQGAKSGSIDNYPDYYFHSLKIIQKAIDDLSNDKPGQKKLSKTNGKSFNALRARFKKVVTEEYEKKMSALTDVKDLKDGSEGSQSSEDESDSSSSSSSSDDSGSDSDESGSESEEEVKKSKAKPKNKFAVQSSGSDSGFEDDDVDKLQGDSDSTSDDSEWDTDSVSSSSSDEDAETSNLTGRAKWLKRTTVVDKTQQKEEKKLKEQDKQERAKARKIQKEVDHEKKETAKTRQLDEELTLEKLEEQIANVVANRGRKNVDRVQLIDQMRKLTSDAHQFGDHVRIITLMHLVSLEFDIKTGLDEYMPIDLWKSAMQDVQEIVSLLNKHPDYRLRPMRGDEMESLMAKATNKLSEKQQKKMKTPEQAEDENPNEIAVVGDLSMFVDRLDNEYEKSLRYMDNHSDEYIERLKDEGDVNELAKTVFEFFLRIGNKQKAASQALLTLENNYYKHKTVALQVYHAQLINKLRAQRESGDNDIDGESKTDIDDIDLPIEEVAKTFDLENDVLKACNFIFENGTEEMTCKAMLCQIYHYAIHDNFFKARDLLLMSRLQDSIYSYDIESQILFNRAIVQLGICAFRVGKIKECHSCLIEICQQGNKTKELLAQGVYWRRQAFGLDAKALEAQQRAERRRILPYHKHINLDMLEFFHLCSAMLLEIPNMAAYNNNTGNTTANMQPYVISRTFRRHLEQYSRQVFTGPPENTRDHVLAAAMYLKEGEWKKCADLLLNLQLWKLQPSAEITKKILVQKIKEESLRTYMLTYSSTYQSLSADHLCQLFELSVREVHQLISKMIINDELKASWDQTSNSLILHKNEPTHLQALALNYAEKLSKLVENNESKLNTGGKAGFDKSGDQEKDGDNGSFNVKRNFVKGGRGQSKKQNAF